MAKQEPVICVGCPVGCEVTLVIEDQGEVADVFGNLCKEGRANAMEEYRNPVRVLTTTVIAEESSRPLLPVRTSKPVLKTLLKTIMQDVARVRVKPPLRMGDVIISNIGNTEADLVAASDLSSQNEQGGVEE
jgi:CxxC motif-containing protein